MLAESPSAFAADLNETTARPIDHFRERTTFGAENFIIGAFKNPPGGDSGDGPSATNLIGSVGGLREQEPKRRHLGYIWGMYVHADHRGGGIGRDLLGDALRRLDQLPDLSAIGLSVTAGNAAALALYEQAGFTVWGREPLALRVDGEDYDELHMLRIRGQ